MPSLERHLNDLTVAVDRSRSDTYDNLTVANCTAPAGAPCPDCCRQVWHADRVGEAKGGAYVDAFPYDCRLRPWYQGALRSGWPLWTPPYVFATSQTIGTTAAMTLRDYYGSPVGALGIDVSFEEISRYLALNAAVFDERNMTLFVFDRLHGDKLIASSKGNFVEAGEGLRRPDACGDAVVERAYAALGDATLPWHGDLTIVDHFFVYSSRVVDRRAVGINWTMVTTYPVGCLPGTYENVRVGCDDCRLETWSGPESAACDVCARTFYDVRGPDADRSAWPAVGDCRRCPPEADCASPDTRLEALPLQPGYMRMAADSTELLRCRVRAACPGGYFGVGVRSCERGFGGAYCSECRAGYYAAPDGSACRKCAGGPLSPGTIALIAFYVLVAFAVVGLLFGNVSAADAGGLDDMSRLGRLQNKLRAKWKLCFVSVQIATMTPNLLPKFPDYVAGWYVALVEGLAVFNFAPRFPGGSCAGFGRVTFHDALVATTAGPFALMGCVALWGCRVDGCVRGGRAWGSALKACLLVLYVILPTICSTIIDAFYCTDGLDGGVQYYKADLLLPCRGDRHALATIYAAECIAIYVAGIPCCFVVALWYHRGILDPKVDAGGGVLRKARRHEPHYERLVRRADAARRREPATRNLQILWGPFVPRFYWFEVLELARRLFATSFVKILTYRPALRLLLSLLSALAFLKAQIKAEPFVEAADNVLAETLLWIIILNYLALLCVVCSIVSSDAVLSAVLTCLLLLVFGVTVVLVFRDVDRERKAVSELVSDASSLMLRRPSFLSPKKVDDAAAAEDAPRPPRDVDLTRVDYEAEESKDGAALLVVTT